MMKGISDHGFWRPTHAAKTGACSPNSASSEMTTAPAPASSTATNPGTSRQIRLSRPTRLSTSAIAAPSRPIGARIRTRLSTGSTLVIAILGEKRLRLTDITRRSRKDPCKLGERRSDKNACGGQLEFTDRMLVVAAALLYHRDGAPDRPLAFEISQHEHRVAEIADV